MSTGMNLTLVIFLIAGSYLLENETARWALLLLLLVVGLIAGFVFAPQVMAALGFALFGAFAMQKCMWK